MTLKANLFILTVSLILILLTVSSPGGPALALDTGTAHLPAFEEFVSQVKDGRPGELRGVYVPQVLAVRVVQQPENSDYFVSSGPTVVTQFAPASRVGATGLLAHNFLAGERFSLLQAGQTFYLIYGDGQFSSFRVTKTLRYQALEPDSPLSEFISLENGNQETATQVFEEVYDRPGRVVFQTCIAADGDPSWGRLFVIAESYRSIKLLSDPAAKYLHRHRRK
jgi:hypothetical protein